MVDDENDEVFRQAVAESLAESLGFVDESSREGLHKIYTALRGISDDDAAGIGYGPSGMDMWVEIKGREYFITASLSSQRKAKDSH